MIIKLHSLVSTLRPDLDVCLRELPRLDSTLTRCVLGQCGCNFLRQGKAVCDLEQGMRRRARTRSRRLRQRLPSIPLYIYTSLYNYTCSPFLLCSAAPPLLRCPTAFLIATLYCGWSLAKVVAPASALVVLPGLALVSSVERGQRHHFKGIGLCHHLTLKPRTLRCPRLAVLRSFLLLLLLHYRELFD